MKRIELQTNVEVDVPVRCYRSSGDRWNGMALYEVRTGGGEVSEGYYPDHIVSLTPKVARRADLYLPGQGWKRYRQSPSQVNFLPRGMPYAARWEGPIEAIMVGLSAEFVARVQGPDCAQSLNLHAPISLEDRLLADTMLALANDVRQRFPMGGIYGEHLGTALVTHLLLRLRHGTADGSKRCRSVAPLHFANVIDYIHAHPTEDLSLLRLASMAELGTAHFIRAFKKSYGVTPHQYVLRIQIERAKTLLRERRTAVIDVALECGFADHSHFSKLFRRMTGTSPAQYRDTFR